LHWQAILAEEPDDELTMFKLTKRDHCDHGGNERPR